MKLRVDFSMKICIVAAETRRWFLVKVERHKMAKAKTIVQITDPAEMAGFIKSNGTQCRFVSFISRTPVEKIRRGHPWTGTGLFKVARQRGIINVNYAAAVERRIADKLGIDVNYVPGKVWFNHIMTVDGKPLPLVENKNPDKPGLYLQFYPHRATSTYVTGSNEPVAKEAVAPWLYSKPERSEFKPPTITVKLAHILELRASGVILQAEDLDAAEAAFA